MKKLCFVAGCVFMLLSLAFAQKDEDVIKKLDADWSAAAQNKDVEKTASVYADDASVLPNKGAIVTGTAQIRDFWAHLLSFPGVKVNFAPTRIDVAKSKDMAYDVGTYELTMNDDKGNPNTEIGKYVVVWKKQADKQWKVVADIFNPDK
jgi:uncharacterized protein (TIGR02246 family)